MNDPALIRAGKSRWLPMVLLACALVVQPAHGAGWSLILQQGELGLALPDIHVGDWSVTGIHADVVNSIEASPQAVVVQFKPGSRIRADRIVHEASGVPTQLNNVRLDLAGVSLTLNLRGTGSLADRSTVAGNVIIDVDELRQPQLNTQGWRFEGRVAGALTDLNVEGLLRANSGLVAEIVVRSVAEEFLAARITLNLAGKPGSRALADTLAAWPELLDLNAGEVKADASLRIEPGAPLALEGLFDFAGVDGLIDRTAVTDLSGRLLASLEDGALTARFRDVTIGQINSGIGIGPIRFLADYRARQADPFAGVLDIQQASASFLGGRLRVAPGAIDLAAEPWELPVDVYEVSLARLLQVYPAEGFSGTGELTGRVPVIVSAGGIAVEQGRVAAVAPGGLLQLPADRLQAMLGRSQAMEQVVQALQNFHYSVLDSTIDYDNKGRLVLGLRLEGKNPEAGGGQPVVLNINLEEDIPALLTSLQLSGRVNEAVTERVRERLQQSGQEAVP